MLLALLSAQAAQRSAKKEQTFLQHRQLGQLRL